MVSGATGVTNLPTGFTEGLLRSYRQAVSGARRIIIVAYEYNTTDMRTWECSLFNGNVTRAWSLRPTRAEMDAATVKTITITATADTNGYLDTGLKYNQVVPLCIYSVTVDGSAAYPFLYEFLMRGGSPAERISVRIKKWNGEIYTGEITFSMKYI